MSKTYDVAVVGTSGLVGETLVSMLEERDFPVGTLYPLENEEAAGGRVEFRDKQLKVTALEAFDFSQVQIAFFVTNEEVSAEYVPRAAETGCVVIDRGPHFRLEDDIPLVVPEVNPEAIADYTRRNIIASPSCASIQLLMALKPIDDSVGVERVNVATYQAVSGAGKGGVETLAGQTAALLNAQTLKDGSFPKQMAFNVLPQVGDFLDNGYTREEMKIVRETQKVLENESLKVNPTAVRVPVFFGHSEAVHIETREKISAKQAHKLLQKAPGIEVLDGNEAGAWPTAVTEAANEDAVFIGRIREDISSDCGLNLWLVTDNSRKGAALNCVQVAEILVKGYI
ncbi:MAG: aspartate-semialdehyde dehydrogenase [Gammaproteobacteria bacterium]|nr:aspartate-semialdehyde dehydrogenase [Gammaproteobacteria bacterium]